MATDIKSHIAKRLESAGSVYVNDLQALSEEALTRCPGGVARSPYDFTYEVIFLNKRIVTRLTGGDPGPFPQDGWMMAPSEFKSKDQCIADLEQSVKDVLDAWNAIPDDKVCEAFGPASALDLASLSATHMSYHDAQLNYIQAMNGDAEMHWNLN